MQDGAKADFSFLIGQHVNGTYDVFDMDHNRLGGPFQTSEEANQFCNQLVEKGIDELRTQGLNVEQGETLDTTIYEDSDAPISISDAVKLAESIDNGKTVH